MTIEAAVPEVQPPAAPPPPPEPLGPVSGSERVDTIDILRGLALFGILAANIRGFAGPPITYMAPHLFWPALHDRIAQAFIDAFIQQKFITIFAFLFGVGFAVQFDRATARGAKFGWTYARRLFLLLLFGLVHGLLIWFGDVLLMYALDGFLLILFRKRANKTVAIWAAVLLSIMPLVFTAVFIAVQAGVKIPDPTPKTAEMIAAAKIYGEGTFADIQVQRMQDAVKNNWGVFVIFGWQILGLFLLGLLAWRKRFFHPTPESLPRYRRAMWWGLGIGIAGNVGVVITRWALGLGPMPRDPIAYALGVTAVISVPALSLGYVCLVIVMCQSEAWRNRLHRFGAIGRTALTNYLLQSIIGTLIFYNYGLGLFGDLGPALLLPLTFVIFAAQMYLSPWWLERYRFGPVEWLWRRLTYGGPLPMRREPVPVPGVVQASGLP